MKTHDTNKIYDDEHVYNLDGVLIFKCNIKKSNWYLERNLAKIISEGPPRKIQLLFKTNGDGNKDDLYSLSSRENACVVCGSQDGLTKHHVVPYSFRRFFPDELKDHNFHDVLLVCEHCHCQYEEDATVLKRRLSKIYNDPLQGQRRFPFKAVQLGNSLWKFRDFIPVERQKEIEEQISKILNIDKVTKDIIEDLASCDYSAKIPFGKIIVDSQEDLQDFIVMWRKHFLHHMSPRFLPENWDVHYVKTLS